MKINICTAQILRRTFVRQLSENDCGQACAAMLLRYAGEMDMANKMLSNTIGGNQSLLSLRNAMISFGFQSQCVSMTLEFLEEVTAPCILHTENIAGNMHYQVCYGKVRTLKGWKFLMADPAKQFYYIGKDELDAIWKSKTGLLVEELKVDLSPFEYSPFSLVIKAAHVPAIVWIVMPVLTLINALFGVALSFLLQRGFVYNDLFSSRRIIIAVLILLLIISIFKSVFSYLRQIILLKINKRIRQRFFEMLAQKVNAVKETNGIEANDWAARAFHEISLMQNALSLFLSSLVSEGSLLVITLCAITYTLPAAGVVLAGFLLFQAVAATQSYSVILYKTAVIRQKSASIEKLLLNAFWRKDITVQNLTCQEYDHQAAAEEQAIRLCKKGVLHEIAGALVVVIVLALTAYQCFCLQISYPSLMFVVILSYITVSITPRLFSSYITFAEGADAFMQFTVRTACC